MSIGTLLFTWLHGTRVGTDGEGNVYYQERRERPGRRRRRWVLTGAGRSRPPACRRNGMPGCTTPPTAPLPEARRAWVKPHQPNRTGTPLSYRPAGHDYAGGKRARATGDYEAWTPGQLSGATFVAQRSLAETLTGAVVLSWPWASSAMRSPIPGARR